ncbi:hypothetical protein [Amycolatopsis sp. NPDC004625]|uniref:hypothetical protein n=1 Tax=Amycolatopsis sp. NPDC004625 TaxID=3154670 RepID=UPI0033B006E0
MTVIDLYWAVRADDVLGLKAEQMVEAVRNAGFDMLDDVIRGWVEQLTAQAVLSAGTEIAVHSDTATIRQPRRPEPDLTLGAGDWLVHAGPRLLVVTDDAFREGFRGQLRSHA